MAGLVRNPDQLTLETLFYFRPFSRAYHPVIRLSKNGLETQNHNYICRMEVNDALVDKLAHLAKLHYNEEQKAEIKDDLQKMIAFVEKLNELDTTGVSPLLHMSDEVNVLRDDIVKGSITREEALRNAPLHDGRFFKVPKVIKK